MCRGSQRKDTQSVEMNSTLFLLASKQLCPLRVRILVGRKEDKKEATSPGTASATGSSPRVRETGESRDLSRSAGRNND